ncbi:MAG: hypothetical protein GC153_13675 [Alphaproteobacteria bacterium]|nr:hypothetical protein [Alphaproteobacteria bacterium]
MLAVRQPSDEPIEETALDDDPLHITDVEMKEWLRDLVGALPPESGSSPENAAREAAYGLRLLSLLQNPSVLKDDEPARIGLAIAYGSLAEELFRLANRKKSNPIYAMEAFILFRDAGLYPPRWVLDWLHDAFASYLGSNGEKDISTLLGVKRGRGSTDVIKEAQALRTEGPILFEMILLNAVGISADDAAAMIVARCKAEGTEVLAEETLVDRFTSRRASEHAKAIKSLLGLDIDRDALWEQLKTIYPSHSLPSRRK